MVLLVDAACVQEHVYGVKVVSQLWLRLQIAPIIVHPIIHHAIYHSSRNAF